MKKSIFVVYRIYKDKILNYDAEIHLFSNYIDAKYFVKTHKGNYYIWEKQIEDNWSE